MFCSFILLRHHHLIYCDILNSDVLIDYRRWLGSFDWFTRSSAAWWSLKATLTNIFYVIVQEWLALRLIYLSCSQFMKFVEIHFFYKGLLLAELWWLLQLIELMLTFKLYLICLFQNLRRRKDFTSGHSLLILEDIWIFICNIETKLVHLCN